MPGDLVSPYVGNGTYLTLRQDGIRTAIVIGELRDRPPPQRFHRRQLGIVVSVRNHPHGSLEALVLTQAGNLGWLSTWQLNMEWDP